MIPRARHLGWRPCSRSRVVGIHSACRRATFPPWRRPWARPRAGHFFDLIPEASWRDLSALCDKPLPDLVRPVRTASGRSTVVGMAWLGSGEIEPAAAWKSVRRESKAAQPADRFPNSRARVLYRRFAIEDRGRAADERMPDSRGQPTPNHTGLIHSPRPLRRFWGGFRRLLLGMPPAAQLRSELRTDLFDYIVHGHPLLQFADRIQKMALLAFGGVLEQL